MFQFEKLIIKIFVRNKKITSNLNNYFNLKKIK